MPTHPISDDRTARDFTPTLGLLPVLAVSTMAGGAVHAQEVVTLDTITLEIATPSDEARSGYLLTDSTSRKVPTAIADTPKTITVVTEKEMKERGATSVYDVLRTTPGITLRAGEGGVPAGDIPQIRGFDASNDILVDGIRNSSRTSYEAFNLESIEVTKGPGGAANGAGAEGGTISLNTKTPLDEQFTDVGLSYGTGNFKRATLDTNRKFDRFGTRLNLMYQDADDLGGKDGKTSERWGIAPSFSYDLTDATRLTAGLYYYVNKDMPDYGVRMSAANVPDQYRVGSGTVGDPWRPIDVEPGTFYGTPGRDFTDNTSASGYLRLDHDFDNGLTLTTSLRKGQDRTRYLVTQPGISEDGTQIARGSKSGNRKNETLSYNAQISGQQNWGGIQHSFGVGVDISSSEARQYGGYTFDPAPGNVSYENPDLGHWNGTITEGDLSSIHKTRSQTIYAFDTMDLTERLTLSLGLSYDHYDVKSRSWSTDDETGVTTETNARVKSNLWNGSVGLAYDVTENGMIYAGVSSSSKPGGLGAGTGGEAASDSLNDLDPERTRSYEIGTKWSLFDGQALFSAAAFRMEKDNARVAVDDTGLMANVGETRSQGIELGLAGQITDKWGISAGYVYQDVKLIDGGYTGRRELAPNPGNGWQLVKTPRNSFSLWTTYAYNDKLTFGGGATYTDKRVASYSEDGAIAEIPSSWQVDLMAAYQIAENTALQVNINNVFDENVYGDSHSTQHVYTEPGRNVVVTLNHRF